jgi:hypothetical protein
LKEIAVEKPASLPAVDEVTRIVLEPHSGEARGAHGAEHAGNL